MKTEKNYITFSISKAKASKVFKTHVFHIIQAKPKYGHKHS